MEIMRWLFVFYLTGLVNLILVPTKLWTYIWANIFVGYSHSELAFFSGDFNFVSNGFENNTAKLPFRPAWLPYVAGKGSRHWHIALCG